MTEVKLERRVIPGMVPAFQIVRRGGELELFVGARPVAMLSRDEHGLTATRSAEEMFRKIAFAVGAEVRE